MEHLRRGNVARKFGFIILCILLICGLTSVQDSLGAQDSSKQTDSKKRQTVANNRGAKKPAVAKSKTGKKPALAESKTGKKKAVAKAKSARSGKRVAAKKQRPVPVADIRGPKGELVLGSLAVFVEDQRTGECIIQKNPLAIMPIASITKLMTAMVTLDAQLDLNEVISVDPADVDNLRHSRSRLAVGTHLTRQDALLLALMASENRAAHALGRTYPGGTSNFVAAMNVKARSLELYETSFADPTGLSGGNKSSARDLARLVNAAYNYSIIREFTTREDALVQTGSRRQAFRNTNPLVRSPNWQIGLSKTGFIDEAGRCLVMQAYVAKRPVLIVLLDSQGKLTRTADANRIKQWMESHQSAQSLAPPRRATLQGQVDRAARPAPATTRPLQVHTLPSV